MNDSSESEYTSETLERRLRMDIFEDVDIDVMLASDEDLHSLKIDDEETHFCVLKNANKEKMVPYLNKKIPLDDEYDIVITPYIFKPFSCAQVNVKYKKLLAQYKSWDYDDKSAKSSASEIFNLHPHCKKK